MGTIQQSNKSRQEYTTLNATVLELLNIEFAKVRQISVKGVVYYLACDVCDVLELTNTSTAIKGLSDTTLQNSPMKTSIKIFIEKVNPHRKVNLISIEAVFEIILKNKSCKCREIKEYFSRMVLPKCAGLMGAQS